MKKIKNILLNFIFPSKCVSCHIYTKSNVIICNNCLKKIPKYKTLYCGSCRARLAHGKKMCHKSFPYILGIASDYSNKVVRDLVHELKFSGVREIATVMAQELVDYIDILPFKLDGAIIISIPLGATRLKERGFNQAELVAKKLSEKLGLRLGQNLLIRTKNTKRQSELVGKDNRAKNVAGCFRVNDESKILKNKVVILIDDVVTSGSTFLEASRKLKSAGLKRVYAIAFAGTLK